MVRTLRCQYLWVIQRTYYTKMSRYGNGGEVGLTGSWGVERLLRVSRKFWFQFEVENLVGVKGSVRRVTWGNTQGNGEWPSVSSRERILRSRDLILSVQSGENNGRNDETCPRLSFFRGFYKLIFYLTLLWPYGKV